MKSVLRILIASQNANAPIVLDTGIASHATPYGLEGTYEEHVEASRLRDEIVVGDNAAVSARQLLTALEQIDSDDFQEGRSYYFEGARVKRTDGRVHAEFNWGS